MKIFSPGDIRGSMDALMDESADDAPPGRPLDVTAVYARHADFVWQTLQRLGAPGADVPDLFQEVFVVLHRRRDELDAGEQVRGLLFGIAVGLVRNHRRRAKHRRDPGLRAGEPATSETPDDALERSRRRSRGLRAFERLDPEKRAVFVMFELEGMSGEQIATTLGIPLGTVHSRLHAARRQLERDIVEEGDG